MTALAGSPVAGGSRAFRPGSRRGRLVRTGATAAIFAVLFGGLAYGAYALWYNSHEGYVAGNPAKWLPEQQLNRNVDRTLVGTYASPAITVVGDLVRVETPTFSATAVVTGPLVPGEGFTYQPSAVVATWTVHIYDVKGHIPLSAADFDSIDHVGTEFKVLPPAGTTMPTSVSTGGHVTFDLRGDVPIGEDLFRWAPNGNNIVAKWDNQVEND